MSGTSQTVELTTKNTGSLTLGIISVVMGSMGLLFCWIPILGLAALPLAGVGGFLACLGCLLALMKKGRGFGMPLIGGAICGMAIVIAVVVTGTSAVAMSEVVEQIEAEAQKEQQR